MVGIVGSIQGRKGGKGGRAIIASLGENICGRVIVVFLLRYGEDSFQCVNPPAGSGQGERSLVDLHYSRRYS